MMFYVDGRLLILAFPMLRNFKSALYDDEIYNHIYNVVHKVKKTVKLAAEVKSSIDEFEALLLSIRNDADGRPMPTESEVTEDQENDNDNKAEENDDEQENAKPSKANAKVSKKGGSKKAAPKSASKGKSKSKRHVVSSDEEDNDEEDVVDYASDGIDEFDSGAEEENKSMSSVNVVKPGSKTSAGVKKAGATASVAASSSRGARTARTTVRAGK
jgi:hypothetical protein